MKRLRCNMREEWSVALMEKDGIVIGRNWRHV
jgi:hypothetical protein